MTACTTAIATCGISIVALLGVLDNAVATLEERRVDSGNKFSEMIALAFNEVGFEIDCR